MLLDTFTANYMYAQNYLAYCYLDRIAKGKILNNLTYNNVYITITTNWDTDEKYNEFTTKHWQLNLYNAINILAACILEDRYYHLDSVEWNDTTWYTKFNIEDWLTKCRRHNIPIIDIMKNYEIDILNKTINEFSTV